jgi:hypothetical protein
MTTSEQVDQIATALSAAQGMFSEPKKTKKNPHYKSMYAPLDEIIRATKDGRVANGLSITQGPRHGF